MSAHIINPELQAQAFMALANKQAAAEGTVKQAFIPAGDQSMGGGGGDPSAGGGGGMPPGADPTAGAGGMPGGDAGGGAPGGGGGGQDPSAIAATVAQLIQPMIGGGGAGAGAGGEGLKPKIDVNVALVQILKMLARIADALNISIPAAEMVVTSPDLNQFAQQQQGQAAAPAQSAIPPIAPMQPAAPGMGGGGGGAATKTSSVEPQPFNNGTAFEQASTATKFASTVDAAVAIIEARRARRAG